MIRAAREASANAEDGTPPERMVLERGGLRATWTNFGATLIGLEVPDRHGTREDVVLGFDTLEEYASSENPYFGGIVGRCANRIAGARFELDGREYLLTANEGRHHLHGGERGFDRRVWHARVDSAEHRVDFSRQSPAGEEGYPGALQLLASYRLLPDMQLELSCTATCDAPTLVNLTQHSYFNLAGNGSVADHLLEVCASQRVVVDDELIPSGLLAGVQDSPFDMRTPRRLGECIDMLGSMPTVGLDACYALDGGQAHEPRLACRLSDPRSGRRLEVFTTQPGLQVYTGNHLAGLRGKHGVPCSRHSGVCLETQHFPDAVHHPHFQSVVLRPGATYRHVTRWRWRVDG